MASMEHRYKKHYSLDEARKLLPSVRKWLKQIGQLRKDLRKLDSQLEKLVAPGVDLGGKVVNTWVRANVSLRDLLLEFFRREIQIKDIDRGLIDFPAIIDDEEVFLCWEEGEEDIEFWHRLDAGYAGRERLTGLE
jgi:hypothetical protein